MNQENLIELAKKAVTEAGKAILDIYHTDDFEVENKSDDSPLTRADKAAHRIIVSYLEKSGLPILSEEGANIDYEVRKNWDRFWLVDPLDGTKEFIKKNGEFTVNIALIEKDKPIAGAVYAPVLDWLYWSTLEGGAFKQENVQKIEKIVVNSFSLKDTNLTVVASRSHLNDDTQAYINNLNTPSLTSMGSSLKLLLVAEGKADLYPRFAPTMEWDTAAADAIVRAAGGKVLQKGKEAMLEYNKKDLLNPHFLVVGMNQ